MRNSRLAGWLVVVLSACFDPSFQRPACGPNRECPDGLTCSAQNVCGGGGLDITPPPDPEICFGSFVKLCFESAADLPGEPLTLAGDISTDDSVLCNQRVDQARSYCVIAGSGLTIASTATVRAFGRRPLVLLSTGRAELSGVIDVSSNSFVVDATRRAGAGANPTVCPKGVDASGNSGGYGGSFGGRGGDGETVDGSPGMAPPATAGPPASLRGGCPGGSGSSTVSAAVAAGGSGGGAVAIVAGSVQLGGRINASGGGGQGGPALSGGGGGGSGGMIVLDTPAISGAGILHANGGGGGQGGMGGSPPRTGQAGGESTGPAIPAPGGNDDSLNGGFGGAGSAGMRLPGGDAQGGAQSFGGGGAGGGGIVAPGGNGGSVAPPAISP